MEAAPKVLAIAANYPQLPMGVVLAPSARGASAGLLSNAIGDDAESFFTALRSAWGTGGGGREDALRNEGSVCEARLDRLLLQRPSLLGHTLGFVLKERADTFA